MKRIVGWVGLLMVLGGLAPGVHATSSPKVTVQLIITNAQGSVVAKMTPDGVPTYSADYRPYGTTQSTPQAGPGYTGHVMDPTSGLVYMQQRYYDPATGRFISPDPVAPTPGNVFNFGRYTYANDNPIRFIDPEGRYPGAKDNPCSNASCKRQRQIQQQDKWIRDSGGGVIVYSNGRTEGQVHHRRAKPTWTGAAFHVLFGAEANEISRPNNPFRVSNQRAHKKFMVFAGGAAVALSPYAVALGVTAALPPVGDAALGWYAFGSDIARTHGKDFAMAGCLLLACNAHKAPDPGQFAEQKIELQNAENGMKMVDRVYNYIVQEIENK